MFYSGSRAREAKRTRAIVESSTDDKLRRHRNKERIWRRCVVKLQVRELEIQKAA